MSILFLAINYASNVTPFTHSYSLLVPTTYKNGGQTLAELLS